MTWESVRFDSPGGIDGGWPFRSTSEIGADSQSVPRGIHDAALWAMHDCITYASTRERSRNRSPDIGTDERQVLLQINRFCTGDPRLSQGR